MDVQKLLNKSYDWIIVYGPRILLAFTILFIGIWLIRVLRNWFTNFLDHRKMDASLKPFLHGVTDIILKALLVLAILQILGIQMTIFAALVGAFGVAAGLALSGTLQNFTSGILILLLKPFRVGDNIVAQGQEGSVVAIQIFSTKVLTFDNKTLIVPNSKLSNETIINLSRQGQRRMDIELKFNYDIPFESVQTVIKKAIDDSQNFLKDPPARVVVEKFMPDGYIVSINIWIHAHGFNDTRYAFQQRLLNVLRGSVMLPGMK